MLESEKAEMAAMSLNVKLEILLHPTLLKNSLSWVEAKQGIRNKSRVTGNE
jgi:hypothetical protein